MYLTYMNMLTNIYYCHHYKERVEQHHIHTYEAVTISSTEFFNMLTGTVPIKH